MFVDLHSPTQPHSLSKMSQIRVVVFSEVEMLSNEGHIDSGKHRNKIYLKVGEFDLIDRTGENRVSRSTFDSIKAVCHRRAAEYRRDARGGGHFGNIKLYHNNMLRDELQVQGLMEMTDIAPQQWADAVPSIQKCALLYTVYAVLS